MTHQDISDGKRLHASECPVALAVKRNLSKTFIVMARGRHIYINDINSDEKGAYYKPSVPQREMVANFIADFDQCLDVQKLPAFTIRKVRS